MTDARHVVTCNGRRVPLHPTGTQGEYVAGVRYRAWQPPSLPAPDDPGRTRRWCSIVVDTWHGRSLGGCTYHVAPSRAGCSSDTFPVNAYEAESRRAARFFAFGHTPGKLTLPAARARIPSSRSRSICASPTRAAIESWRVICACLNGTAC